MTLEELRIGLLDSVRNCTNPHTVEQLITDAEKKLNASRIGDRARRGFWDAVDHDLVVITQEASMILGRGGAANLRTTIDVARAALTRYREGVPSGNRR